ncbi:subtilisin-like protein [Lepidopterella palustris CBS 459.81]|uniref:Subtilisin-like protein n=1 Tax=Lepidopterella palustris CBS 459.81 TaxID=1314670 RepID=A0A8E2DZK6_9PEZI|nr:subtilisin-like protein [Lepidopterella palustris CBS 459.81]
MTHNFMYGLESRYFGFKADGERYKRVKVAILDNGIAYRKREHRNAMRKYWDCVVGYESFIDHENAMDVLNDDSGHGTAVTFQVMKTCPTAEVYICRVVQKIGDKWIVDQDAVARAIYQAADGKNWGVDIINMSFGWDYNHRVVGKAISFAKDQGVLLFASTSNYGLTTPADILYPASADEVISVDAADGLGNPAGFNPSSVAELGKDRFTAPGIGLCSPISDETFDGTSFASPIAAGVAALVLEFARQSPLENCQSVAECLRDRLGMVLVLRAMSKRKGEEKFKFLCPEMLLGDAWGTYGGDGRPGTRRYFVAYELVQILRKSYGKEVGQEVFPTVEERKDVAESGVA